MPATKPKTAPRLKKYRMRVIAVAPVETEVEVEATNGVDAEEAAIALVEKSFKDRKWKACDDKLMPEHKDDIEEADVLEMVF